jgi:cobalamin biosynthesis Mg chelatase CobN
MKFKRYVLMQEVNANADGAQSGGEKVTDQVDGSDGVSDDSTQNSQASESEAGSADGKKSVSQSAGEDDQNQPPTSPPKSKKKPSDSRTKPTGSAENSNPIPTILMIAAVLVGILYLRGKLSKPTVSASKSVINPKNSAASLPSLTM